MNNQDNEQMDSASALFDSPAQSSHTSVGGVTRATATLDNGMVNIDGLELPRETAVKMGLLEQAPAPEVAYETSEAAPEESVEEAVEESTEDFVERIVSEEAQPVLDEAVKMDGGAVNAAISEIVTNGDLSEGTIDRLRLATGADADFITDNVAEMSDNLNNAIDAFAGVPSATDMLMLAAEATPNQVSAAVMAAVNGDVAAAADIARDTYAKLDQTHYAEPLIEALEADGYTTSVKHGRLYVRGHEFADPTAWATAAKSFAVTFE